MRHRVLISACAAALAAFAGVLYAPMTGIVDPSVFSVALSVQVFVWVALGGAGTLIGPLIAAVLLTSGQATLSGSSATVYLLITGIGFILVVLFLPGGLASLPRRLGFGRRRARSALPKADAVGEANGSPDSPEANPAGQHVLGGDRGK
ncbi:MAG: ABC transporter permease subunit [Microcella pacifica]